MIIRSIVIIAIDSQPIKSKPTRKKKPMVRKPPKIILAVSPILNHTPFTNSFFSTAETIWSELLHKTKQ
jgi:hypothetical protein